MNEEKFNKVKYNNKYNAKAYDRLSIVIPKGKRELLKSYAEKNNTSINKLINDFIDTLI